MIFTHCLLTCLTGGLSVPSARRVVTWEPVPRFRAFLLYNILVNGVGHLVEVRDTVVSNDRELLGNGLLATCLAAQQD